MVTRRQERVIKNRCGALPNQHLGLVEEPGGCWFGVQRILPLSRSDCESVALAALPTLRVDPMPPFAPQARRAFYLANLNNGKFKSHHGIANGDCNNGTGQGLQVMG